MSAPVIGNEWIDLNGCGSRAGRPSPGLAPEVLRTVLATFGRDVATANIEFRRVGSDRTGCQG